MATAVKPPSPKALTEEDLSDIFPELIAIQAKWYNFGLVLNIPDHVLQSIEYRYPSSMDCLREVIKYFLRNHPDPTWETIVEALRSRTVGHANLAKQLEDKKCCEEEHQLSMRELQQQVIQLKKEGSERESRIKKLEVLSQQQEKSVRETKFGVDQRQRDMDERFKKEELKGRERDGRLKKLELVQSKQKSVEFERATKEMRFVGPHGKIMTFVASFLTPDPYKILLIGETGSGKTSFLNFICNAEILQRVGDTMKAVKEFRPFNDVKLENAPYKLMESKTTGAKVYRTKIMDLDVDIIDTPAFADSRGMEQDKKNVELIVSRVSGEDYINCVCLIINGRQSRVSVTLKYVLSEITAILPRQVLDNIVVVFTNVSERLDLNFDVRILEEYFGQPVPVDHVFFLENPYYHYEKAKEKQGILTEQWINGSLRKSLEDANVMLKNLHKEILKIHPVHTYCFDQLFDTKQAIERNLMKLLQQYHNQQRLESEMKTVGEEIKAAAARSKSLHKDYIERKTVLQDRLKAKLSSLVLERRQLLKELNKTVLEFQQLGLNRSYIMLLENQIVLINQRMDGKTGDSAKDLMFLKQLEEKKKLVQEAMT